MWQHKKLNLLDKMKSDENVPDLEVAEVDLAQCNLLDNQYQHKSNVLFTYTLIFIYLLNVEPRKLVFLKTYTTEFDEIIMTFMDQNGRPLEIEDKVNLTLLINK